MKILKIINGLAIAAGMLSMSFLSVALAHAAEAAVA